MLREHLGPIMQFFECHQGLWDIVHVIPLPPLVEISVEILIVVELVPFFLLVLAPLAIVACHDEVGCRAN